MNDFSLIPEYLAFLFTAIIMLFYYDKNSTPSQRRGLYWGCLASTMGSIVLDIATVWVEHADVPLPNQIKLALNTAYYAASILMSLVISYYLLRRVYERTADNQGLTIASAVLILMGVAYVLILAENLYSGRIFYFDAASDYHRGDLTTCVYAAPLIEAFLIIYCYFKNSRNVSGSVTKVVRNVPILVFLLIAFQLIYPNLLLNGTYGTLINLIIFISFQSSRLEIDPMTELGNRQSFVMELERRRELKQDYQVIFVALRSFAQLNQVYGHQAGNSVLFQAARRLQNVTASGFAYRVGGDVFALLVPTDEQNEPSYVAHLVSDSMKDAWIVDSHHIVLPSTTATLRFAGRNWTSEGIINRMEFALSQGKVKKQPLVTFDTEMASLYERQVALETTMQKAIEEKRFETWFQPIRNLSTGSFDTAEALIRLRDERGNLVRPDEFIPLAETSELINRLTWIVLEDSCRLLSSGKVPELERISVNLTARQLLQRDLARKAIELIKCYGLEPRQIKFEITERTVADNKGMVAETMAQLHKMGFDFMMDDFGTGYSNLSSALNMPFAQVKLDKSLVDNITTDERACMMCELLVPFFHKLDQTVVAEGIETQEQAKAAAAQGVDYIQGYLYARPMDRRLLVEWYARG